MFNFLKKKEPADRKTMREEFEEHTKALKHADDLTQMAVGYAINMAHSMFIKRFGSAKNFCKQSSSEKIEYLQSLVDYEEKIGLQDPLTALGFSLFKKGSRP